MDSLRDGQVLPYVGWNLASLYLLRRCGVYPAALASPGSVFTVVSVIPRVTRFLGFTFRNLFMSMPPLILAFSNTELCPMASYTKRI